MKNIFIPPVLFMVSLVLIAASFFVLPAFNLIPFPYNLAGLLLIWAGIVLNGKVVDLCKKYNTPHDFCRTTVLIEEGVFTKSRNPMYIGMFLFLLGLAVCFMNLAAVIFSYLFLFIVRIAFITMEEKKLEQEIGQSYLEYKVRVKRWF
ncbi:MAG: isoprenylcysteine carboxylmethyltransferase family protein [Calditrichaceae bacterium]|nr:isoprenylcysteine carboxylmethyltransferase family protein [Calditrichaceae bacterium]RQV92803.1 MAG: isoprenylcysteine carboxylmethyltransferase family protein [Calditrichota bacterium]